MPEPIVDLSPNQSKISHLESENQSLGFDFPSSATDITLFIEGNSLIKPEPDTYDQMVVVSDHKPEEVFFKALFYPDDPKSVWIANFSEDLWHVTPIDSTQPELNLPSQDLNGVGSHTNYLEESRVTPYCRFILTSADPGMSRFEIQLSPITSGHHLEVSRLPPLNPTL